MTLGFGGTFTELETSGTKKVGAVSRRVCLAFQKKQALEIFPEACQTILLSKYSYAATSFFSILNLIPAITSSN